MTESTPTPAPRSVDDDPRARVWGVVLIAVAVAIGLVLLWKGFSQEGGVVDTASPDDEVTTTTTGEVPLPETTTTTATTGSTNPPAQVSVLVANGSGATGVAGRNADRLGGSGYTKVETTNGSPTATSVVYYASGAQGDATAVAQALGIATVQAMPTPPPVELDGATVLVVVGSDKA